MSQQPSTESRDCICEGNWRLIVAETAPLIGRYFQDERGEKYRLFGVVHGGDDYYYGMSNKGRMRLLSCVGSIEGHGFTPAAEAPAQPKPAPILKAKFVNWEQMLLLTLEDCVKEHDKVCSETCNCPHGAIMAARFVIETELASKTRAQPIEPRLTQTAEQFYRAGLWKGGFSAWGFSYDGKVHFPSIFEFATAFAAHELAASRTEKEKRVSENWISVDAALPKIGRRVLISISGEGFKTRTIGLWTGQGWNRASLEKPPGADCWPIEGNVTHWLEIPEHAGMR